MFAVVGADIGTHLRVSAGHLGKVLPANTVGLDECARVSERAGRDGRVAEVVPRALDEGAAEEDGPTGGGGATWSVVVCMST